MAAHVQVTDQVEEDAADLQFPKDWLCMVGQDSAVTSICYICSSVLHEPFIRCVDCKNVEICSPCFSVGAQRESHKNYHQYIVLKTEFPLYVGSTWTASEESRLLDAVLECGLGNWSDISRRMQTRSSQECEKHYLMFYIDKPARELPKFKEHGYPVPSSSPCFEYRLVEMDEPPRYLPGSSSYRALSGYNAARGDFEVEYDNCAEVSIAQLDLSEFQVDDKLGVALQTAIVSMYNMRLRERARRKRVIRDHGLILVRKTLSWLHRYEVTVTRPIAERLLPFMQLMSGIDFDYIMEGLHCAGELRQYILRLQELRSNGITHFNSCRLYRKLLRLREMQHKERRLYQSFPVCYWKMAADSTSNLVSSERIATNVPPRRPAPPLDIVGLPGYERLSPAERHLCSTVRLVPESYLDFRRILMAECKRNSGLKLAHARTLIKIDVNKTRKLYDFLLKEGFIHQPS